MVQFDENRLAEFCRRNAIVRLRMFGSMARGEERPDSDIDLLADFGTPVGFFEVIRAEDDLSEFFGRPVDLLTEPGLSPHIREAILQSAVVIFDGTS